MSFEVKGFWQPDSKSETDKSLPLSVSITYETRLAYHQVKDLVSWMFLLISSEHAEDILE